MKYETYVVTTLLYGLCGALGVAALVYFASRNWFLAVLSVLFAYVAMDNFFCGSRLRRAGGKAEHHYVIPPFLRSKR